MTQEVRVMTKGRGMTGKIDVAAGKAKEVLDTASKVAEKASKKIKDIRK